MFHLTPNTFLGINIIFEKKCEQIFLRYLTIFEGMRHPKAKGKPPLSQHH